MYLPDADAGAADELRAAATDSPPAPGLAPATVEAAYDILLVPATPGPALAATRRGIHLISRNARPCWAPLRWTSFLAA